MSAEATQAPEVALDVDAIRVACNERIQRDTRNLREFAIDIEPTDTPETVMKKTVKLREQQYESMTTWSEDLEAVFKKYDQDVETADAAKRQAAPSTMPDHTEEEEENGDADRVVPSNSPAVDADH